MLSASKSGSGLSTGYNLTRSLRFRASASAYLNRTFTTPTNNKIWTLNFWLKIGTVAGGGKIFSTNVANTPFSSLYYDTNANLTFYEYTGTNYVLTTTQVFRDPSAWYMFTIVMDTTQATASNRTKFYVNGTQITSFSSASYVPQNTNTTANSAVATFIGQQGNSGGYFDGYLAEVNFIDGQALTPSSFGSTNALTGVWQPAAYTGTYGTNGFYLPFTDNSALTTASNVGLGKDFSGNGNYWTTNNISITAGVTYDSMTDVPTLTSATASNFCVWNPLSKSTSHSTSDGNLTATSSSYGALCATIGASSGKWYWEMTYTNRTATNSPVIGFGNELFNYTNPPFGYMGSDLNAGGINVINGNAALNGASTAYGSAIATNDVVMFAMDVTNRKFYIGKNGTWFNSGDPAAGTNSWPYSATIVGSTFFPAVNLYTDTIASTFGQRPFTYTPPTGFVALNTYNLPTSTIVKGNTVMDATLWTGNSSTQSIVNAAPFKPDFVWIKNRTGANNHALFDSVRGATLRLYSDSTIAEQTEATTLTAFNSNGFSVSSSGAVNASANNYVGWQWQAGQGSTSSNTNGSITSTVSVNASAGFSVVTLTTTAGVKTVGHGLGVAPALIIVKPRAVVADWYVYGSSYSNTQYLKLNTTDALITDANLWNSTTATSSVFTLGSSWGSGNTLVAYCWTPIAGYSAFGSLTGNGSADGVFVYLGFKPRFILYKRTDSTSDWRIWDTARTPYNAMSSILYPNVSDAEFTASSQDFDALSNGFKIRNSSAAMNASGGTYIYAAFSSNPFKNSLAQ
jgi:hypothetical protein